MATPVPAPPGVEPQAPLAAVAPVAPPGQPTPAVAEKRDVWSTPLGILGFIALSAALYAFLDPTFGLSATSLATLLGLMLGLVIILVAYAVPLMFFARNHRIGLDVRALPATLLVAVFCVLVSRLSDFQPGYLYGLVVGIYFAHSVSAEVEGKAEAVAAGVSLLAALAAWIVLAFLRAGATGAGDLSNALLGAMTVTVVVAGIENAFLALLPLRFMPGAAVYDWNRRVWALLIALGAFAFVHVLLNPSAGAGYLSDSTRTSFATMVVLLAGFGVVSVLFWAWFRFRPRHPPSETRGPAL